MSNEPKIKQHGWTLANSDESERANVAGRLLFEVVRIHENREHDGDLCSGSRASVIALVAHGIGLPATELSMTMILDAMRKYEEQDDHRGGEAH